MFSQLSVKQSPVSLQILKDCLWQPSHRNSNDQRQSCVCYTKPISQAPNYFSFGHQHQQQQWRTKADWQQGPRTLEYAFREDTHEHGQHTTVDHVSTTTTTSGYHTRGPAASASPWRRTCKTCKYIPMSYLHTILNKDTHSYLWNNN